MSAPVVQNDANDDAGVEKLEELFDEIGDAKKEDSQKPGVFATFVRNPLMAFGLGATAYYLSKGIKAASKGESLRLAEALQKRVVGQFGTLVIFMGTFAYMVATNPEKQKSAMENDALLKARAMENYRVAQLRNG